MSFASLQLKSRIKLHYYEIWLVSHQILDLNVNSFCTSFKGISVKTIFHNHNTLSLLVPMTSHFHSQVLVLLHLLFLNNVQYYYLLQNTLMASLDNIDVQKYLYKKTELNKTNSYLYNHHYQKSIYTFHPLPIFSNLD